MSNLKYALEQLNSKLQEEANQKIKKALELFFKCDDEMKVVVLHATGFKGELTFERIRDHFDTLDLMDNLDHAISEMEWDLENNRKDNE
ncbi:hypothetical protein I6Y99_004352 [Vibrio parahaemolyticus]|nr:hypothetical protein [Vibrio parahaemolyticus]